ncbi:DUF4209 domain-containing protein [Bacillus paranthracis]
MQYLFVNKGGKNLRNRLAHGLMSEEGISFSRWNLCIWFNAIYYFLF